MTTKTLPGASLAQLLPSWDLSLQAANKSPKTIVSYLGSVRSLVNYLDSHGLPTDSEAIEARHVRAFLLAELERTSAVTAQIHYRNLRVFFGWLAREGERTGPNPMAGAARTEAKAPVKPFLTEADQAALLKVCSGQEFE